MFRVIYTIKEENKLLVDKYQSFHTLTNAVRFIKKLKKEELVSKPILEEEVA